MSSWTQIQRDLLQSERNFFYISNGLDRRKSQLRTWSWGGWRREKSCGRSSSNCRVYNRQNCREHPKNKCTCGDLFGMFMEAIAFIVSRLTRKTTVAEICTVQRDHRSWEEAAVHLSMSNHLYISDHSSCDIKDPPISSCNCKNPWDMHLICIQPLSKTIHFGWLNGSYQHWQKHMHTQTSSLTCTYHHGYKRPTIRQYFYVNLISTRITVFTKYMDMNLN